MSNDTNDPLFAEDDEIVFTAANDVLIFAADRSSAVSSNDTWKIMLVDDEEEIHNVTKLALVDFTFEGRGLTFTNAYSGQEARQLILEHPDTALILLDVVMETDDAGLAVAKYIREEVGNHLVRIVLRTGQPGQAPENTVIINYDINDYKAKTELTTQKLYTTIVTSLRAYGHVTAIETHRRAVERLASASARFVPREFLSMLEKESIVDVELGDHIQHEMTIMFSDVRSFTTFSEGMTPKENFDFINNLLNRICPVIRDHNGFVDKYMGDGVMALFPQNADDALQAAIAMHKQLIHYNDQRQAQGQKSIQLGIGLHTGVLMLGTIGEAERMEGTVISDAVNLASRIEGLTKKYGAGLIISAQTLNYLKDPLQYNFRFVDKVQVKGKNDTVSVFEVFDGNSETIQALKIATKENFKKGIFIYYEQNFPEASVYFNNVLKRNPKDEAARLYLQRAAHYMIHGVPEGWSGTEVMNEK